MSKEPNILGIPVVTTKKKLKRNNYAEDVDLLINDYNDTAYMYSNGNVDIIKGGNPKSVNWPTKKEAALYLMKAGWKYV